MMDFSDLCDSKLSLVPGGHRCGHNMAGVVMMREITLIVNIDVSLYY